MSADILGTQDRLLASACLQPTEASALLVAFILNHQLFGVPALERIFGVPLAFTPEELAYYAKVLSCVPKPVNQPVDAALLSIDDQLGVEEYAMPLPVIKPAQQSVVETTAEIKVNPEDVYWNYWMKMNEFVVALPPHFRTSWARATSLVCLGEKFISGGTILFPFDFLQPAREHNGHNVLSAQHAHDISQIIYGDTKRLPEWLLNGGDADGMNGDDLSQFLEAVAGNPAVNEYIIRVRPTIISKGSTFFDE